MSNWQEAPSDRIPFISYEGELPKSFFRYRSIDLTNLDSRLIDFELNESGIYLSGLDELNDPCEGRLKIEFSSEQEAIIYWMKALSKHYPKTDQITLLAESINRHRLYKKSPDFALEGVYNLHKDIGRKYIRTACFTIDPTNMAMWANYAKFIDTKNHQSMDGGGLCIEYQFDDEIRKETFHPVFYTSDVPVFNPSTDDEKTLAKAFLTKSPEWTYEQEWRLISTLTPIDPQKPPLTCNSKLKFEGAIKRVIFGLKTPKKIIDHIINRTAPNFTFHKVLVDNRQQLCISEVR